MYDLIFQFTLAAAVSHYQITGYHGSFTSFLDGGQFFRAWLVKVFSGDLIGLLLITVVIGFLYLTWKITKQENTIHENTTPSNKL